MYSKRILVSSNSFKRENALNSYLLIIIIKMGDEECEEKEREREGGRRGEKEGVVIKYFCIYCKYIPINKSFMILYILYDLHSGAIEPHSSTTFVCTRELYPIFIVHLFIGNVVQRIRNTIVLRVQ